jgi:hypothetical protein
MKCPKCGYHSFDHPDSCKKCGQDLNDHKAKFNLRGFFSPDQPASQFLESAAADETAPAAVEDNGTDFGFDFLDEEEQDTFTSDETAADSASIDLGADQDDLNIQQPFGIDSETVPAGENPDQNKDDKDSGFEF